jgi:glycosyltransferase involved in cell wall biosynthesis
MAKISAVIMTYNEERNLGRCLESIRDVAEEIVIVDSFSTDRTEEISREYGARFIRNPFAGYVEQREYCIGQATHELVLVLDADEALSPELKASVLEAKNDPKYDAYYVNRLNHYCGQWIRHSGWYPDRKLRLFRLGRVKVGGRNPHDEIIPLEGATARRLPGDLLHYTYYTVDEHIQQVNRFTAIQARGAYEQGKRPSWFQILLAPPFKFLRSYIFHLGILDGYYGFLICRTSAYSTFLKHAKLKALYKSKK